MSLPRWRQPSSEPGTAGHRGVWAVEQPMQPVTHINVVLDWFEELKRRVPTQ